eukprot:3696333-Rhodomonas_salina.1
MHISLKNFASPRRVHAAAFEINTPALIRRSLRSRALVVAPVFVQHGTRLVPATVLYQQSPTRIERIWKGHTAAERHKISQETTPQIFIL